MLCVMSRSPGLLLSTFAGVVYEHLVSVKVSTSRILSLAHLRVLAAFEEGRYSYQPNVVVPHHSVLAVISRHLEGVLKDCNDDG